MNELPPPVRRERPARRRPKADRPASRSAGPGVDVTAAALLLRAIGGLALAGGLILAALASANGGAIEFVLSFAVGGLTTGSLFCGLGVIVTLLGRIAVAAERS